MGNISGQSKNDQIHLFLENINIPHLFHQASWEIIRFFGPTILDKIDGKFVPLSPPKQGWENGAVWLLRGFNLDHDLRVMEVCWHFILSKILGVRLFQAGRLFNFSPVSASS